MMCRREMMGFLFGALLLGIPAHAEEKTDPVAEYKTFLASLPKDDPASLTKAIDQYRAAIVPLDMNTHEQAFLDFLDFHNAVCDGVDKAFWERLTSGGAIRVPENDSDEVRQLRSHGLEIRGNGPDGEYIGGIPDHIPSMFSPYLPLSIRRYLESRQAEMREGYQIDAVLLISYAQLAQRVADWERYLRNYPDSPLRTEALILRAEYLLDLLIGLDNSPLDPVTDDRSKNIRFVYQDFLRAHPGTYAAGLVREQYDYLKKKRFFAKPFDEYNRAPSDRYDEIRKQLCLTVNLDAYRMDRESGYRAKKVENK